MALPLILIDGGVCDSDSDRSQRSAGSKSFTSRKTANKDVVAVVVNTNSIMLRANSPQYTKHSLPPTDAIFATRPASISEIFGMPLIARPARVQDLPQLSPYLREAQVPNLLIRSLFRECDVTCCDKNAGIYEWDHEFGEQKLLIDGPVILARKDGRPLHLVHAKMILEYVEREVDPLFDGYQVERKRWRKRIDGAEYREKINELRGNVEVKVKEATMRAQWHEFKKLNAALCAGVGSPWDD